MCYSREGRRHSLPRHRRSARVGQARFPPSPGGSSGAHGSRRSSVRRSNTVVPGETSDSPSRADQAQGRGGIRVRRCLPPRTPRRSSQPPAPASRERGNSRVVGVSTAGLRRKRLGESCPPGYPVRSDDNGLVDEETMAKMLDLSKRTLADYRRRGRFAGCWIRNGRHIRWRVAQTLSAWERGIA